jgi:hypothetical protein
MRADDIGSRPVDQTRQPLRKVTVALLLTCYLGIF